MFDSGFLWLFCFVAIPLVPAGLIIGFWSTLGFRFPFFLEAILVAVVNTFSLLGWIVLLEESYSSYAFLDHSLSNYAVADFMQLIGTFLFSYLGFSGLLSGLLMYWGARQWKQNRIGGGLLFLVGCGIVFISALLPFLGLLIREIG